MTSAGQDVTLQVKGHDRVVKPQPFDPGEMTRVVRELAGAQPA